MFACDIIVVNIVGFVEFHQTVAFGLHRLITLVDREIKWSTQICIGPRLALFYLEGSIVVSGHQPYDNGHGADDQSQTDEEIAPCDIVFCVETAHFVLIYSFMMQRYTLFLIFNL